MEANTTDQHEENDAAISHEGMEAAGVEVEAAGFEESTESGAVMVRCEGLYCKGFLLHDCEIDSEGSCPICIDDLTGADEEEEVEEEQKEEEEEQKEEDKRETEETEEDEKKKEEKEEEKRRNEESKIWKVRIFLGCSHCVCDSCFNLTKKRSLCPLCRGQTTFLIRSKVAIKTKAPVSILDDHFLCNYKNSQVLEEYLAKIDGPFEKLVQFMLRTLTTGQVYFGIAGSTHLKDKLSADRGRILDRGERHVLVENTDGKKMLIFTCLIPQVSIRMQVVEESDQEFGVDFDRDLGERVVSDMVEQLRVCWRAFPYLLNREHLDYMYVNRYGGNSCYLLLAGNDRGRMPTHHNTPMRERLRAMPRCNFDESRFEHLRKNKFPLGLSLKDLSPPEYFSPYKRCIMCDPTGTVSGS